MGNMFKHTPLAAEARITALERELAALKEAYREFADAYDAYRDYEDFGTEYPDDGSHIEKRFLKAKAALKALLGEGETDGSK